MVFQISFVVRYHLVFQPETCNRCVFLFGQFPYIMAVHFLALVPSTCGNAYFHNARIAFVVIKHEPVFVLLSRRERRSRRINVSAKPANSTQRNCILPLRFQSVGLLLGRGARLVIVIFRRAHGYGYRRPRLNKLSVSCPIFYYVCIFFCVFFFVKLIENIVNSVAGSCFNRVVIRTAIPITAVYGKLQLLSCVFIL